MLLMKQDIKTAITYHDSDFDYNHADTLSQCRVYLAVDMLGL